MDVIGYTKGDLICLGSIQLNNLISLNPEHIAKDRHIGVYSN